MTPERLREVEGEMGISPGIVVFFLQWPSVADQHGARFPLDSLNAVWSAGAIPCLTWEPMVVGPEGETMVPYRTLLNGAYDPFLREFAREAASWGRPFMIRFAHEMNTKRYHWGTDPSEYGPESPAIYREMFAYVVTLFRKAGAQNVVWVFCPNAESVPDVSYDPTAAWNRMEDYYPGSDFVDVLGMDGYNWGTTQTEAENGWTSHWKEFEAIFCSPWRRLRRLAPEKPIMVFETATVSQGGHKMEWIRKAFKTAGAWNLNGLIWFQVDKENDWRIQTDGEVAWGEIHGASPCTPHQWIGGLTR